MNKRSTTISVCLILLNSLVQRMKVDRSTGNIEYEN